MNSEDSRTALCNFGPKCKCTTLSGAMVQFALRILVFTEDSASDECCRNFTPSQPHFALSRILCMVTDCILLRFSTFWQFAHYVEVTDFCMKRLDAFCILSPWQNSGRGPRANSLSKLLRRNWGFVRLSSVRPPGWVPSRNLHSAFCNRAILRRRQDASKAASALSRSATASDRRRRYLS